VIFPRLYFPFSLQAGTFVHCFKDPTLTLKVSQKVCEHLKNSISRCGLTFPVFSDKTYFWISRIFLLTDADISNPNQNKIIFERLFSRYI